MTAPQTRDRITVRVALFADLRRYAPRDHRLDLVELPVGATPRDVLHRFGIPDDQPITVGRNGDLATLDAPLEDGDDLMLMNPMEGG